MRVDNRNPEVVAGERPGKARRVALWVLQILLAINFLFAGGAKLGGMEPMVAVFDEIGIGQWFRYVTGLLEVAGAILLVVPGWARIGAAGLAVVMVGAVTAELFVLSGSALMPLVLLALLTLVAFARRAA